MTSQAHLYNIIPVQKAEPLCLASKTRTGRLKSSFVPWELSLPTLVAHGHGHLSTWLLFMLLNIIQLLHKVVGVNS